MSSPFPRADCFAMARATTYLALTNWKEIIDDELALDTVVDKLQHGSLHIVLEGESYRKKRGQKGNLDK